MATSVGGIAEIVRDGDTDLLVPHADADALARPLLSLLGDPALAARFGADGQSLVRGEFSLASFRHGTRATHRSVFA